MHRRAHRRLLWTLATVAVALNARAAFYGWRFTHLSGSGPHLEAAVQWGRPQKLQAAQTGIPNPRPASGRRPGLPHKTVVLYSDVRLECWWIPAPAPLFNGYTATNSAVLDKAADVKACWNWLVRRGERRVFVAGTSTGAAAILKAVADDRLPAAGLLLKCPFVTMYGTAWARFRMVHTPLAALLVFRGGALNGFPAFRHNPATYATAVRVPLWLQWGARDDRVTHAETDAVSHNLRGPKHLRAYPDAGHDNFLTCCRVAWTADVTAFPNRY